MNGLNFKIPEIDEQTVRDALDALPANHHKAVYLRYYESLLIEEIANKMKISWATANRLIDQGLLMMKKTLLAQLDKRESA